MHARGLSFFLLCSHSPTSALHATPSTRMPPRSRTSRTLLKSKPKTRAAPTPSEVSDAEDALNLGIRSEERCERYMTSVGATAYRAIVTAGEYFERAHILAQAQQPGASRTVLSDATYNGARTLFTVASQFALPPYSIAALDKSLVAYALAAQYESVHSSGRDTDFKLDIAYNRAAAFQARADLVFDLGVVGLDPVADRPYQSYVPLGGAGRSQGTAWAKETSRLCTSLSLPRVTVGLADMQRVRDDLQSANELYNGLIQAYIARLRERTIVPEDLGSPPPDPVESDGLASGQMKEGEGEEKARYVYEGSHVNLQSVLDALESSIGCLRQWYGSFASALDRDFDPAARGQLDQVQRAMSELQVALDVLVPDPNDEEDRAAHVFARERLALWGLELRLGLAEYTPDPTLLQDILALAQAAQTGLPEKLSSDAEAVLASQAASLCLELAGTGVRAARQTDASAEGVQATWDLAAIASKLLLRVQVYGAGQPGTVLNATVASSTSAGGEMAREANLALAQVSELRASQVFAVQHSTGPRPASETVALLLTNARVYIRRALSATSLSWALTGTQGETLTTHPHRARRVDGDTSLFWEKVRDEAYVLELYARIAWARANHSHLQMPPRPDLAAEGAQEAQRLAQIAWSLVHAPVAADARNDEPQVAAGWALAWVHNVAPSYEGTDGATAPALSADVCEPDGAELFSQAWIAALASDTWKGL